MNDKLENETELSSSSLAKNLSAMAIGRYFGVSASQANSVLSGLGWVKKGQEGWEVTELGKSLGGVQSEVKRTGALYVIWPAAILANQTLMAKMPKVEGNPPEAGPNQGQQSDVETLNASQFIDRMIASTPDWRGKTLANIRKIIHDADPKIIEEWKWMGAPVWSHAGIVCIGGIYKDKVVLTFLDGPTLSDPAGLFNAALESNSRRTIDFHEGDKINEPALKKLILSAVERRLAKAGPAKTEGPRKKA